MLTLDAAFTAIKRDSMRPVSVVTLTLDAVTLKARKGWSDDATIQGYPGSVQSIAPLSATMDPFTRRAQVSQCSIVFAADGWMKAKVVAYRLRGKAVAVVFGDASNTEAQMAPRFTGIIDAVYPRPDGSVELKCSDAFGILRDKQITGYWPPMHPLELIADILERAEVPTSLYDATTLDPTAAAYASIGHFVVERGVGKQDYMRDLRITTPTSAFELIEEACQLINGSFYAGEDGKLRFVIFDKTASVRDTWTDADIDPDSFEIVEVDGNMVNQIQVAWAHAGESEHLSHYERNETAAQTAFAYPGESGRIVSEKFESRWLEGRCVLSAAMTSGSPAAGGTFDVNGQAPHGLCGVLWWGYPGGSQPSWAQLSSTKLLYLRVDDEIIACDLATINQVQGQNFTITDPADGQLYVHNLPQLVTFRVAQRGALGTTAAAHAVSAPCYDATIPAEMARSRLERFGYGAPIVRVRTSLAKYALQLGDFVQLSTDKFFGYGKSDASTITWEIIGKEADVDGDDTSITWTLCYATETSPPTPTYGHRIYQGSLGLQDSIAKQYVEGTTFGVAVENGLTASSAAFVLTVAAGKYSSGVFSGEIKADTALTLSASKDSYVFLNASNGALVVKAVANGATAPTASTGEILLHKAITNGAGITSVVSFANTARLATQAVAPVAMSSKLVMSTSIISNPYFQHFSKG